MMSLTISTFARWAGALAVGCAALLAGQAAQAQVSWSVGVHAPGVSVGFSTPVQVYHAPPPVYYAPPRVYHRPPPPVIYRPAPVYYGPPPAYYGPPPGFHRPPHRRPPGHHGHHHGHGHRR